MTGRAQRATLEAKEMNERTLNERAERMLEGISDDEFAALEREAWHNAKLDKERRRLEAKRMHLNEPPLRRTRRRRRRMW